MFIARVSCYYKCAIKYKIMSYGKATLKFIAMLLIIGVAFYLANVARESEQVRNMVANYGYFGIFAVAILSGFNLAVPIPAISFLPLYMESGLNFWLTITLITLGMAVADLLAYLLGTLGTSVVQGRRSQIVKDYIGRVKAKHPALPFLVLFLFAAFVPLPNEVLLIPLALFGYGFYRVFFVILAGNFIFNLIYANGVFSLFNNLF